MGSMVTLYVEIQSNSLRQSSKVCVITSFKKAHKNKLQCVSCMRFDIFLTVKIYVSVFCVV